MYLLPLLHNTYIRPLILSRIELLFNFVFWFLFCYNTRLSVFFCFRNDYCTLVKGSSFSSFYGRNPGYTVIANLEVLWFPCKTLPRWYAGICSLGKCPNRHGKYLVLNLMFSWKCHKCYCGAVRKVCYCRWVNYIEPVVYQQLAIYYLSVTCLYDFESSSTALRIGVLNRYFYLIG